MNPKTNHQQLILKIGPQTNQLGQKSYDCVLGGVDLALLFGAGGFGSGSGAMVCRRGHRRDRLRPQLVDLLRCADRRRH